MLAGALASVRVICVKWGAKYGAEWVVRLRNMCARRLPTHEFVCVTDEPVDGIQCQPLVCDLPGWWQKVGLFRPGLFPGENWYFDLDIVAKGSIVLPRLTDKLWALDDFSYSIANPRAVDDPHVRRLLGGVGTINSSIMGWRDDVASDVWTKFTPAVMDELHGDQNWITRCLWPHGISLLPKGFASSYKYHIMNSLEMGAPIVVFHGQPKVTDLSRRDPLRLLWEAAA